MEQESIAEYFEGITDAVKNRSRGREVLIEVQKIYPLANPDSVLRAYRKLRSPKDKDFIAEGNWREYFRNNPPITKHS